METKLGGRKIRGRSELSIGYIVKTFTVRAMRNRGDEARGEGVEGWDQGAKMSLRTNKNRGGVKMPQEILINAKSRGREDR